MKRKSFVNPYYTSKRRGSINFTGKTPVKLGSVQLPGQYAAVVVDPWNNPPVSIPDLSSVPCAVFSVEQQITYTLPNTTGGFVCSVGGGAGGMNYYLEGAGTSDTTFSLGGAQAYDFVAPIQATYGWIRPIAGSILVEFIGNDQNNQGKVSAAITLGTVGGITEGTKTSLGSLENCRDAYVGPAKDGVCLTWRPKQTQDFDQFATTSSTGSNWQSVVGGFQVHFSGCSSQTSFQIRIKLHYEGIPLGGSATDGLLDPTTDAFVSPEDFGASASLLAQCPAITSATRANNGYFQRMAESVGQAIRNYVGDPSTLISAAIFGASTIASGAIAAGGKAYGGPPGGF